MLIWRRKEVQFRRQPAALISSEGGWSAQQTTVILLSPGYYLDCLCRPELLDGSSVYVCVSWLTHISLSEWDTASSRGASIDAHQAGDYKMDFSVGCVSWGQGFSLWKWKWTEIWRWTDPAVKFITFLRPCTLLRFITNDMSIKTYFYHLLCCTFEWWNPQKN